MCDLRKQEIYSSPCKGIVTIGYRSKLTSVFTPIDHKKNLVMYGAADAMARLVAGDTRYAVSHMYYHYINSTTPGTISPITDRAAGSSFFQAINTSGSTAYDWLRIPIFTSAQISAYGSTPEIAANYAGNMASFVATSASSTTQAGSSPIHLPFSNSAYSYILDVALVCAPVNSDSTHDVVFSRLALSSPVAVQANSYIDCFWGLAFQ